MPRWGAERRARPLHEVPVASILRKGEGERTRAASLFDAARWCASRRSASLLLREEFSWLGFLGFRQSPDARRIAGTDKRICRKDDTPWPGDRTAGEAVPVGSLPRSGSRTARESTPRAQARRPCAAGALAAPARPGGLARWRNNEMKRSSGIGWPSKKPWP